MKILHTYCLNYNIGDYALGIGLKNILRAYLTVDLIGETNIQGRLFDDYYINEVVNKRYDLLVVGGGGIIDGAHWPNGWFWLIQKELIKKINIPFIIYGVGYNYFAKDKIPERAKEHLWETYRYANFFSVRNDGSYHRLLDHTGISASIVPDPGFHVGLNNKYERLYNEQYVILQIANDKVEKRFDDISKDLFIKNMRNVIRILLQNYKVILAPHVYEDLLLSKQVSEGINNCEVWNFGDYAFDHCDKAVALYSFAEFVISMRGHGQIIPIGFNTPVISLGNHPKNKGLMEELGLLEYNVEIGALDFMDKMTHLIGDLKINKGKIKERYIEINKILLSKTERSLACIKESLKSQ